MKFYHYFMIKGPLLLAGYAFGSHDPAFLYVGLASLACIPLFLYFGE